MKIKSKAYFLIVVYDDDTSALVFNESDDNVLLASTGEAGGGYLKLTEDSEGNEIDFSDGFSFELYANLSRFAYDNGSGYVRSGIFCKIDSLSSKYNTSMRFFADDYLTENSACTGYGIGKFSSSVTWSGVGYLAGTRTTGVFSIENFPFTLNTDFYLTVVYVAYHESLKDENENYDEYMIENEVDKLIIYNNGTLIGYTYNGSDSYEVGLEDWNNDECEFYLGVCPRDAVSNLFYLKGTVYSTRLYTYSMTEDEVSENYSKTLRYRASFVNN